MESYKTFKRPKEYLYVIRANPIMTSSVHSLSTILIDEHQPFGALSMPSLVTVPPQMYLKAKGHFLSDPSDADIHLRLVRLKTLTGERAHEPMEKKRFFSFIITVLIAYQIWYFLLVTGVLQDVWFSQTIFGPQSLSLPYWNHCTGTFSWEAEERKVWMSSFACSRTWGRAGWRCPLVTPKQQKVLWLQVTDLDAQPEGACMCRLHTLKNVTSIWVRALFQDMSENI